ncbi:MAG: sulfite exporter TauE/SafE family protein [Terrimicrobiaceae bacterium]|nr:sulfite exporter TauE/SafE family protein [Terrimicrobiaceae bacterium]
MPALDAIQWSLAALAAICIGLSKTGFGGVGMVAILIMANILPARESTGAILPMLIVADVFAVHAFRKFTVWKHLVRVLPPAVAGILTGWWLMPRIDAAIFGEVIGWMVVVLVLLTAVQKLSAGLPGFLAEHPAVAWPAGWLAGVTTMLANAAGAVMTIYLLACRLPKWEFVGTAAWFFFIINVVKVPFSASLGLITPSSLLLNLCLVPGIIAGVVLGKFLLGKIPQGLFEWLLIAFSLAGGLRLAIGG